MLSCAFCTLAQILLDFPFLYGKIHYNKYIIEKGDTMPLSESRRRANDKYIADHYSRIALSMPNEEAAALREYCSAHGLTVAGFIRGLIRDAITAEESGNEE